MPDCTVVTPLPDAEEILPDSLSVIIPTYNREKVLSKALEAYLKQSSPQFIHELLVVDDGSTDGTAGMVEEFTRRSQFPIRYLRQANKGPAAARNFGIREARSSVVLFTDSDIIPRSDLVEQHLEWHKRNPQTGAAVLGYVTWSPEIKATPFMRWYGEGKLFAFGRLRNGEEASFHFFYTCNLSLKTEFLRTSGQFDEGFKGAAFEDIELGYRLSKRGLKLLYNSAAVAYHHQFFSFDDVCRKARANSASAELFFGKEAGQGTQQKPFRAARRIAKGVAIGVAKALSPARRLLDSSFPLPSLVYDLLYWNDATRQVMPSEVEGGVGR